MRAVYLYFLKDPENEKKGYIGKTVNLDKRFYRHLQEAKTEKTYKAAWIRSLSARGLKPILETLAQVPECEWQQWEIDYISAFRSLGYLLVNGTAGGDGVNCTPEVKAKMSAAKTGRKCPLETRAKISAAQSGEKGYWFGKKQPSDLVAIRTAKNTGKKRTSAQCAAFSVAKMGEKCYWFGKKQPLKSIAKREATRKLNREKKKLCQAQTALCSLLKARSLQ